MSFDSEKADTNGHFSFRVFPGKGQVGRQSSFNNASSRGSFLTKPFDIKPGETLQIDIGGGYIVKGQVIIPLGDTPKPVISVDEVLACQRMGSVHSDRINVAYRNGAVRSLSSSTAEAELLRMLGRE